MLIDNEDFFVFSGTKIVYEREKVIVAVSSNIVSILQSRVN